MLEGKEMIMPLNEPVSILLSNGMYIECMVIDELCVMGDIYYLTSNPAHSKIAAAGIVTIERLKDK